VEPAILGLIGVVVGGLLTGGVQLFLDWRKERRTVRQARRLVQGELLNAELILGTLANLPSKTWPSFLDVNAALPTSAWQEHRAQLSEVVDANLWNRLILAYAGLEADRVRLMTAKDLPPLRDVT
jgi:L-fucose isomerase-like protein